MNTPLTFVFFGIVGSGKGTQVELLQKYLREKTLSIDFVDASPGLEYRKLISSGSYTGELVRDAYNQGYLQPDFLTDGLFTKILTEKTSPSSVIMADGYPRTLVQSKTFEDAMIFYRRDDVRVIYIQVGKEEATRRMKLRGRSDDTDEGIAKRFDEYVNNVIPSMNYFEGRPGYALYVINGEQSIEDVHADIIKSLGI
ncbi:MAG: nucleoside monophosphate kinase [Patescibacteria group bacterium]